MANTNCLAGIQCPKCGEEDHFRVEATAMFNLTDDGTDFPYNVEWSDTSIMICSDCQHVGTVAEFTI